MTKSLFDDQLKTVANEFSEVLNNMIPLVSDMDYRSDFLLSKILYFTSNFGKASPKRSLIKTALALEILKVAIDIGSISQNEGSFSDDRLLSTDYLYAEAIGQVVGLNKPFIVSILAKSIANTAANRANDNDDNPYLEHLIVASYELGTRLGECDGEVDISELLNVSELREKKYIKRSMELIY